MKLMCLQVPDSFAPYVQAVPEILGEGLLMSQ